MRKGGWPCPLLVFAYYEISGVSKRPILLRGSLECYVIAHAECEAGLKVPQALLKAIVYHIPQRSRVMIIT